MFQDIMLSYVQSRGYPWGRRFTLVSDGLIEKSRRCLSVCHTTWGEASTATMTFTGKLILKFPVFVYLDTRHLAHLRKGHMFGFLQFT